MSRSVESDTRAAALRALAVQDLQLLLGSEPNLASAFGVLAKRTKSKELRKFCQEGVTYTQRRVVRIRKALHVLAVPASPKKSAGLTGLIADAKRVGSQKKAPRTDVALLGTIERISHFGLAVYTTIDRNLRGASAPEARRILLPSIKEKREAIGEMGRMARGRLIPRLDRSQPLNRRR